MVLQHYLKCTGLLQGLPRSCFIKTNHESVMYVSSRFWLFEIFTLYASTLLPIKELIWLMKVYSEFNPTVSHIFKKHSTERRSYAVIFVGSVQYLERKLRFYFQLYLQFFVHSFRASLRFKFPYNAIYLSIMLNRK